MKNVSSQMSLYRSPLSLLVSSVVIPNSVMYTVLGSLAACGCLGVAAAAAGVFVCHA